MISNRNFMPMHGGGGFGGFGGTGAMNFSRAPLSPMMPQSMQGGPPVNIAGAQFGAQPQGPMTAGYGGAPMQVPQGPPPQLGSLGQALMQMQQRGMQPQPAAQGMGISYGPNPRAMPMMR